MTINVETSSLREIFDYVKNHLLTQNKRAKKLKPGYENTFNCVYRSEDGCKCAVGCLIPDAEYDIKMEGKGVQANGVAKAIFPTFAKEAQAKFLTRDIFKDGFGLEIYDLLKEKHEEQHKKIKLLNALQDTHDNYEPESWRARLNVVERDYL